MSPQAASGGITSGIFVKGVDGGLEYNLGGTSGFLSYGGTPTVYDPLEVHEATVTLDESWSPYCQAELVVPTPDTATLAKIDPRNNPRMRITLYRSWTYPIREPQERTFDLLLRGRSIDHDTGLTTLRLSSDEGYLNDRRLVANSASSAGQAYYASLRSLVQWVLAPFGGSLEPGDADVSMASNLDALVWKPGVSAWDYLQPIVQAAGLRLFCDEMRRWYLVNAAAYSVPGQVQIAASINLTRGRDTISREDSSDWYDSVVVAYNWTASDGSRLEAYDSAGAPGTKTLVLNWERPYPGAGAAAAILARAQGKGRVLDLEALPDFTATPGKSIIATLPNTPIQTGEIANVTWRISEGEESMTIGSRGLTDTPANAWLLAVGPWSAATGSWTAATGTN